MFAPKKKVIPPGVLLPSKTRLVIILHLCILFSIISWIFLEPFMGNLYHYRTQLSLYETVMGNPHALEKMQDSAEKSALTEKLTRNAARFASLSEAESGIILDSYEQFTARNEPTAFEKFKGAFHTLLSLSPYLQGWLLLSFAACLFLLLRIEGGAPATWLLFFLACAFTIQNQYQGIAPPKDPDAHLFPSEQILLTEYLHEEPASSISDQYDQLKRGWEQYLITAWGNGDAEEGEFLFNLNRLKLWIEAPAELHRNASFKHSLWLLIPFCLWNLFFALFVNRKQALK